MVTQAQIDRLAWFHEFDFPDGLTARSRDRGNAAFHRTLWSFIADQLALAGVAGKSVIDVGCWDGYFSFMAETLGAARVLAVDDFSQNWGTPESFHLAKALRRSAVELRADVSVYELARLEQRFDVVLLFGVYYHLHAPSAAFAGLRALCHDDSVVLVEGACIRDETQSCARFALDNPGEKFIPTTRLLREMLEAAYFTIERMALLSDVTMEKRLTALPPRDVLQLARGALQAKRRGATRPDGTTGARDRVMLVARPVRGVNPYHRYRPPFGLDQFDTRAF